MMTRAALALLCALLLGGCPRPLEVRAEEPTEGEKMPWAIAIHGGAGTIPRDLPAEIQERYREGLTQALTRGAAVLEKGGRSLDAVEAVVRSLEDNPLFNAGKGAVFSAAGAHELDASIMDGRDLSCGAVAAARTPKNPVSLARAVMEQTRHVLLAADGADAFAESIGAEQVQNDYFSTEKRRRQWDRAKAHRLEKVRSEDETVEDTLPDEASSGDEGHKKGTVGAVALDIHGDLAAATSTGGLTHKRFGRVGDSPLVGAGTYADNRTVAVSGTGTGEEFIRHQVAFQVSARMALKRERVEEAARHVVFETLAEGDGGLIAVDKKGNIAMPFSTAGMYRGAADASGRFEIDIWEDRKSPGAP